jgi:hypothetical protein
VDLLAIVNPPEVIAARTTAIHQAMLAGSRCIRQPNFVRIDTDDLARLLALYDREFLGGWLAPTVKAATPIPLAFRLSSTMTRAGGKTIRHRQRMPNGDSYCHYEIAIASRMLFMTFGTVDRPVVACGLTCTDRLQALQRIFEHELLHLAEFLAWDESSCSGLRFKRLARSIFGHLSTKHALVTPGEQAFVQHGVRVGSVVEFTFQGRRLVGRINRIRHRATVLVEDAGGMNYSDGRKYLKFYVPLGGLRAASEMAPRP